MQNEQLLQAVISEQASKIGELTTENTYLRVVNEQLNAALQAMAENMKQEEQQEVEVVTGEVTE